MTAPVWAMEHVADLMRAFRITTDDLVANRHGVLGQSQRRRLYRHGRLEFVIAVGLAAGVIAVLLVVAERPLQPVQVVLAAVAAVSVLVAGATSARRAGRALGDGRVECLVGAVTVRQRGRAGMYLTIARRTFRLPIHFWNVHDGATYRVYVAPSANRVVAMEPEGWV